MKDTIKAYDHNINLIVSMAIQAFGNNVDLNHIDVSEVTDMTSLFCNHPNFNGNISKWNVKNVTHAAIMFKNSKFNGDISNWNMIRVEQVGYMFENSSITTGLENWFSGKNRARGKEVFSRDVRYEWSYTGVFVGSKYYKGQKVTSKQLLIRYNAHIIHNLV